MSDTPLSRATEPTTDRFFEDCQVWLGVCSPCDKAIGSKEQYGKALGVFRLGGYIVQTSAPSLAQCAQFFFACQVEQKSRSILHEWAEP